MKKLNRYLLSGILFNCISIVSSQFNLLPDIIEGACLGIGLVLLIADFFAERYDLTRFKTKKLHFLKKVFSHNN